MTPRPPILFVRPRRAFWVAPSWDGHAEATLQALAEGCFKGTWCIDTLGGRWDIVQATLVREPRVLDKLLRWRCVRVALELGDRAQADLGDVVEELCRILSAPDYDYATGPSAEELQHRLRMARSAEEVIGIVQSNSAALGARE